MKVTKIWLCLAAAFLTIFVACKKDDNTTPIGSTNWPGETVKASFVGQILDEAGQPVADAVVRVGSKSEMSDANGIFIIRDQNVNSARAIVTAFKSGYWDAQRTLFVQKNSENRVIFRLLEKKKIGSFTASAGGKVAIPGGAELDFPAGAISKNGQIFTGNVNVAAHWLNPTDDKLAEKTPGALRGLTTDGDEKGLATFGMVGVELTDDSGQKLEVASGKTAEITMPIPASLSANAPQSIPLWHFSETEGIWVEEGQAEKIGSNYVGQVAHFSWWNCDQPFNAIKLKVCLEDEDGVPLVGFYVYLNSPSLGQRGGMTDSSGCVEGLVPANEVLEMNIQYSLPCSNSIFTQNVGPFTTDTDLGVLTITTTTGGTLEKAVISGRIIDCAGQPVSNGYAFSGNGTFASTDAAGYFSYEIYYCTNNAPTSVSLKAVDWTAGKESQEQTKPFAATVDFGDITACDDLDEYVRYDLDGAGLVTMLALGDSIFFANTASVSGYLPNNQTYLGFSFNHNTQPENDLPLNYFYLSGLEAKNGVPSFTLQTDLTSYPAAVGQYLIGTFGGGFVDQNNAPHTVTGSYRIKRQF